MNQMSSGPEGRQQPRERPNHRLLHGLEHFDDKQAPENTAKNEQETRHAFKVPTAPKSRQ